MPNPPRLCRILWRRCKSRRRKPKSSWTRYGSKPFCPCHRVVTSDFNLGGYGGGLDVKLAFLKRERRGHASKKVIEIDRGKMELFPVEYVLERLKKDKR